MTNVNLLAVTLERKAERAGAGAHLERGHRLAGRLRQTSRAVCRRSCQRRLGRGAKGDRQCVARLRRLGTTQRWPPRGIRKIAESEEFQQDLTQLQQTLARIDRLVAGRENDVAVTLNNLRQITDNLRELSENAKRYPSGVIFGEPPKQDKRRP